MRRLIALLFAGALSAILSSMAYHSVNPDGKTGAAGSPGELTCARSGCHNSFTLNSGTGSVTITAPTLTNWQYVPGQTYAISVTVAKSGVNLYGLCFESLLSTGANGGILSSGTGTHTGSATIMGNARTCITHDQDGGIGAGSHTFTFNWTAPATNIGEVTFYVAGLCANGNGNVIGDYVYSTSQVVTPLSAPAAPSISAGGATTFCEGGSVNLNVTQVIGETYTWFNASNTQVATGNSYSAAVTGCYHVTATSAGGSASSASDVCVTVNPIPNSAFTGLPSSVCNTASSVTLSPTVSGGTFTGTGVSNNSFSPSGLAAGSYSVNYAVSAGGCSANSTQSIVVSSPANAAFTGLNSTYCAGDPLVTLVPSTLGGTFQGNAISGSTFNPSNVGSSSVTYTVISGACTTSSQASTMVNAVPLSTFSGLPNSACTSDASVALSPTTLGGTFSGSGVSGSTFNPSASSVGNQTIVYSITQNGCSSNTSHTISVSSPLSAAFSGLSSTYCSADANVVLVPTTLGGTFSGPGVAGGTFIPASGEGTYEVHYTIVNGACVSTTNASTQVYASPNATFTGLGSGYCADSGLAQLTATDNAGTFSGAGIEGSAFNPATAGVGAHTVTYSISNTNCTAQTTQNVEVYASANSEFSGLSLTYCQADAPVILVPVQMGGVFTGDGFLNGSFDPSTAGVGDHSITYSIDFGTCTSATTYSTTVLASPDATFSGLALLYCSADAPSLLVPIMEGGTFSGVGLQNGSFDPAFAGVGDHTITYSVNLGNCTTTSSNTTTVFANPDATFTGLASAYCVNDPAVLLATATSGGSFFGDGIFESTFVPSNAGAGSHTVFYSVSSADGCNSNTSVTTLVNDLPSNEVMLQQNTLTATAGGASFQWIDCSSGLPIEGQVGGSFTPTVSGSYSVEVTSLGCTNTSACTEVVVIGVAEIASALSFGMYPNPSSGEALLSTPENGVLLIFSSDGRLVSQYNVFKGNQSLPLSFLENGLYILKMNGSKRSYQSMVIIEK